MLIFCIFQRYKELQKNNLLLGLRKEFDTPPYPQQIQLGGQAELRCHPPKGNPEAKVIYWLKNGVRIENDPNFIQSSTGHLLMLQARMMDTANYTCVASNEAIERQSTPAQVTVFGKIHIALKHKSTS